MTRQPGVLDLTATYKRDEDTIHYRYEAIAHFVDEQETVLGNAAASILIIVRSDIAADEACIVQFGGTSGTWMAHPYLREAVAATAQRIGFPGVLLPMIKQQLASPEDD